MNKNLFLFLVVLMSLSLIGIIFVQGYWIKTTVEDKEEQFSYNAKQVLINVSQDLQNEELENFWFSFNRGDSAAVALNEAALLKYFNLEGSKFGNTADIMSEGVVEEDFKVSSDFLVSADDSTQLAQVLNRSIGERKESSTEQQLEELMGMTEVQRSRLRMLITEFTSRMPIHKRLPKERVAVLLRNELKNHNLDTDFEFAVYSNSLATKEQTENFSANYPATYSVPLYVDGSGNSNYSLLVNFTGKKKVVLSSVTLMAALSIMFTLIIVIAYSSALSQLIKQRQISQIKTDFINNMTHEFKTPIATINLALDAIKNPKIISDTEKVNRYLQMIRDENKRMNAQVENVLQISKLDKNELDLKKERLQLHDLIEEAMNHVQLMVEDRNGYIKTHFGALKSSVLANEDHMTNVVVNILD